MKFFPFVLCYSNPGLGDDNETYLTNSLMLTNVNVLPLGYDVLVLSRVLGHDIIDYEVGQPVPFPVALLSNKF